ncbi:MAG: hypothetical protein KKA64_02270 [Nanoarchaeota archaeon]|nr:hypothetical protein [Nanoarchaeota archaeon]
MDFLWHAVSEKEKEDIKKQAKAIMDSFSKKLERAKIDKINEDGIERKEGERKEGEGEESDSSFREGMFSNFRIKDSESDSKSKNEDFEHAPNKNKGFIVAEKGGW